MWSFFVTLLKMSASVRWGGRWVTLVHRNAQVEMLGMHEVTWRVSVLSKHTHKLFKPDNNSS